jgi:hypothetical protein
MDYLLKWTTAHQGACEYMKEMSGSDGNNLTISKAALTHASAAAILKLVDFVLSFRIRLSILQTQGRVMTIFILQ